MNTFTLRAGLRTACAALALLVLACAAPAVAQLRIGTYDSRVIAFVSIRTGNGMNVVAELREKMAVAKEKQDQKEIEHLGWLGRMHQAQFHDQVFGKGSINDLFPLLKDKLAELAAKEKLQLIVSKWEAAYLAPGVEIVDLTDRLVEFFAPGEELLSTIEEIKLSAPVKDALFIED